MAPENKSTLFEGKLLKQALYGDRLIMQNLTALRLTHFLTPTENSFPLLNKTQQLALRDEAGKAMIIWKKEKIAPGIQGVKCLIFLNDSEHSSTDLLTEAMKLARFCWLFYPLFIHFDERLLPCNADLLLRQCGWKLYGKTTDGKPIYVSTPV